MSDDNNGLPLVPPKIMPPLDSALRPAALANRAHRRQALEADAAERVVIALERSNGCITRFETRIVPESHPHAGGNFTYIERTLKFLLWSRGGFKIYFSGPARLGAALKKHYRQSPTGRFDADIMGRKIYEKPFEVIIADADDIPEEKDDTAPLGRHLDGCRIGFDLGASDRKAAAVIDGKVTFSEEIPWDPKSVSDPEWHFNEIMDSLKRAAAHLPRVDAIGGSAAGVYVNNRVQVASLFRGVPDDQFEDQVKPLFLRMREAWDGIPFELVNDGEVTALAGSMALNDNAVLGIAMGSSEAAGYVTAGGAITSWLNELAFTPVDYNPKAAVDEWSGDYGCGVNYFSQQCVGRLLEPAGIETDPNQPLPEKLNFLQQLMAKGDTRAAPIYETIGVYLGYAMAHYADFYDYRYLLILGRVTTGEGGNIIVDRAKHVLQEEFPKLAETISFHIPDEKEKRHGQAIAAASLPVIPCAAEPGERR